MFRKRLCIRCGTEGRPKRHMAGSFIFEVCLFLIAMACLFLFLVPGLIMLGCALLYSLWRLTTKKQVCRACGSDELIPPDSPAAIALRRENVTNRQNSAV